MTKYHRNKPSSDPLHTILDTFFRSVWSLLSWPFRKKGVGQSALERERAVFQRDWQTIEQSVTDQSHWRGAIMNADIMLDRALQLHRIPGLTLGERLKAASGKLSQSALDAAWSAHKVRNRLAHELHYQLGEAEMRQAMSDFKKVIKELGLL